MTQAQGLALEAEVHGKGAGLLDGVGVGLLAAGAQQVLKGQVRGEVAHNLGLGLGRDDDALVHLLRRQGLLDDVLDDRLVQHRQHLLGRHLGARQKAGAQAGGGDD